MSGVLSVRDRCQRRFCICLVLMIYDLLQMPVKQLADRSLVGEKTIQRLRNDEEYPTSVQTVLALCVGLKLPLPEAEMFLGKTDFKLNSMKNEGYVYQCVLAACAENTIYEINEMLKENGITPLGSDSDLQ